ncbi:MAG TPA: hypothetical protein VL335_02060 [Candidatus Paceibacterota bacterium]|jgi:hypothetical protein|nr:hypothetical protein [Candidatus Paceibacterota bacterium]
MNIASSIGREFDDTCLTESTSRLRSVIAEIAKSRWVIGLFIIVIGVAYGLLVFACLAIVNIFWLCMKILGAVTFFLLRYRPENEDATSE